MLPIDEQAAQTSSGCYHLTQVYRTGGYTIRVRIKRDAYEAQSSAVAEVLTPALTWTELATHAPSLWRDGTGSKLEASEKALKTVARKLLDRAAVILGVG